MAIRLGDNKWVYNESNLRSEDLNDTFENFKLLLGETFGDGVLDGCEVSAQPTPDQTVNINSGIIYIGGIKVVCNGDNSFLLPDADTTNPRYDLIIIDNNGNINVVQGTPDTNPVIPTVPSGSIPIAYVYRSANDNTINSEDITDCRYLLSRGKFYPLFEDYSEHLNTGGLNSEWVGLISFKIPAFLVKKRLVLSIGASGHLYMSSWNSDYDVSGSANAPAIRIVVNGNIKGEFYGRTTTHHQSGLTQWWSVAVSVPAIVIDDIDFNQEIEITIQGYNWESDNTNNLVMTKLESVVVWGE